MAGGTPANPATMEKTTEVAVRGAGAGHLLAATISGTSKVQGIT
jgi:hypothetical protein